MFGFKKYVRNCACPERSIAKGYVIEEVIEFCVDFIDELTSIGLSVSRHEGRLRGKGTLGKKSQMDMDETLYRKAHVTILATIIPSVSIQGGAQVHCTGLKQREDRCLGYTSSH
jgi:hypothetical protein